MCMVCRFFFKQKTAYELRIGDWSSDVCSSDLLCQDRRGIQKNLTYVGGRAQVTYELPLNEVVFDFYDRLKSISRGYASFDYHQIGAREGDLVKMSILVNNEPVDALSMIVHRGSAESRGRGMCERMKDLITRHRFKTPIQAATGGTVVATETHRGAIGRAQ